jgi:hypothetical protein
LCRSSFFEFAQNHRNDQRFKNIEKIPEKERLFDKYIHDVRKSEEEHMMRRKQVRILRTDCLPHACRWILANYLTAEY